jgi:N-methylhydantoinase A
VIARPLGSRKEWVVTPSVQVGFDVGGTFTDVIITSPGRPPFTYKILNRPDQIGSDVAACIGDAVEKLGGDARLDRMVHATTLASNAVIEGEGARTGLITTRGFRDEVEIPRLERVNPTGVASGMFWPGTPALVQRRWRREVTERISGKGAVETPLDRADVEAAIAFLAAEGVEAIAISLINAFVNPAHERQVLEIARALAPDIAVLASHEVLPEMREYERTSTTVLHAALAPVVNEYLDRLEEQLGEGTPPLLIMQPNGGTTPASRARARPASLIESGPAAGVLAAAALASRLGVAQAVSLDMGGTTVKACLIQDGAPLETVQMDVSTDPATRLERGYGHALRIPGLDLVEIGAGGGSIAWIDSGGALRIGPHSAGAVPGPACYGRGGEQPTNTDANVVLGYINPRIIAGGRVPISHEAAEGAIEGHICSKVDLNLDDAAFGIHHVANAAMTRAVRAVTVERGRDPRGCSLIAFGGAGPLHAAALAESLDISTVYLPMYSGLFSALGLLMAPLRFDYVASCPGRLDAMSGRELQGRFETMEAEARRDFEQNGVDLGKATFARSIDLRYSGQASELNVATPDGGSPDQLPSLLEQEFHAVHEQLFGYHHTREKVTVASLRLKVVAPQNAVSFDDLGATFTDGAAARAERPQSRRVYFGPRVGERQAPVMSRRDLLDTEVAGPAIIDEFDTTVVVPPDWRASADRLGNIVLRR